MVLLSWSIAFFVHKFKQIAHHAKNIYNSKCSYKTMVTGVKINLDVNNKSII